MTDTDAIAWEVLSLLGTGRQVAPFSRRDADFDVPAAYRAAAELRRLREGRGEQVVGRKIGFTNRTIWDEYGVHGPLWGYMYDTTVNLADELEMPFGIGHLAEPLIEPEIVFGLSEPLEAGLSEGEIINRIGWVAHGFELVQSVFPGWKFVAADTIAGYGLHGALIVGPRHSIADDRETWAEALRDFSLTLSRNGTVVDEGRSVNVLDGPVSTLRFLADMLADDPDHPQVQAGEIITTGTLTRAMPIKAGESWETRLKGVPLEPMHVTFG